MECVVKYLEEKEIIFTLSYILQSLVENLSSAKTTLVFTSIDYSHKSKIGISKILHFRYKTSSFKVFLLWKGCINYEEKSFY